VGKKYVLSNAFQKVAVTRGQPKVVPAYDHYKHMFNGCDLFNRGLHDRKWCHKTGGRNTPGERGLIHKYIMAVIIQNVLNTYKCINEISDEQSDFMTLCLELSDELYAHSLTML